MVFWKNPEEIEIVDVRFNSMLLQKHKLNMLHEESESSERKKSRHEWEGVKGEKIFTDTDIPPWKDINMKNDEYEYKLRPMQADSKDLDARTIIATCNWGNLALEKFGWNTNNKLIKLGQAHNQAHGILKNELTEKVLFSRKQIVN